MPISQPFLNHIQELILSEAGSTENIRSVASVTGGDINSAYQLCGNHNQYFLKVNDASIYPDMFSLEAKGLKTLGDVTPGVIGHGIFSDHVFLLMPWIEAGRKTKLGQENLGRMLAGVHLITAPQFRLAYHNYIGRLPQINTEYEDWTTFFVFNRLQFQLDLANNKGLIDTELRKNFDSLFKRFEELFPVEPPALLHGDLWGGNYLISENSKPYLIDPAIYYGHREMDIAMTNLFGGFSPDFYSAYQEQFPLQPGWPQRLSLWNLYPLLVHVNLFGTSYLPQLKANLRNWI